MTDRPLQDLTEDELDLLDRILEGYSSDLYRTMTLFQDAEQDYEPLNDEIETNKDLVKKVKNEIARRNNNPEAVRK